MPLNPQDRGPFIKRISLLFLLLVVPKSSPQGVRVWSVVHHSDTHIVKAGSLGGRGGAQDLEETLVCVRVFGEGVKICN